MPEDPPLQPCPDCGALVPASSLPTHSYLGASPGCWAAYGQVLSREYADPRFMRVHRTTVDTYAVQHPGRAERRTVQSINVHLAALCLLVERRADAATTLHAIRRMLDRHAGLFVWLEPPVRSYPITVEHLVGIGDPDEHARVVGAWAAATWDAWEPHHAHARALLD